MAAHESLRRGGGREETARRILRDLEESIARRQPSWTARGPEDPGWALLEVFAEALADVWAAVEGHGADLVERALELLGEGPRWARAAEGPVVFVPRDDAQEAALVPSGTRLDAERLPDEPPVALETEGDAWCSPARLLRVASVSAGGVAEIFPYPQVGWDRASVPLFGGRSRIPRYLYLGDPLLGLLRDRSGHLDLEWPGVPAALVEGAWEASVRGGWRAVRLEAEVVRGGGGRPALRLRVPGPIPDLAERAVSSATSAWLRVRLPGDRRVVLPEPVWSGAELQGAAPPEAALLPGGSVVFPRPVFRVLTRHGERWEDHSLSSGRIQAADAPSASDPAIYLGWDRPTAGSVYWQLARRAVPEGWPGRDGTGFPRIAWEHSSGRGFRALELQDSTRSFTQSGVTAWSLPPEWTPQEHLGERLFWIRARWVDGAYASSPVVRAVIPNAAAARQTVARDSGILAARVSSSGRAELSIRTPVGEPEPPEEIEVRRRDGEWTRLAAEGARTGGAPSGGAASGTFRILRAPGGGYVLHVDPSWQGEVEVRVPALRATLGAAGNFAPGRSLAAPVPAVRAAAVPLPFGGGQDPEDAAAYRRRVLAEWKTGGRAVTPADYRRHCLALDPEVARVEVSLLPDDPARVCLWLVPSEPCAPGRFAPERLRWLEESLEEKAPLGAIVEANEAAYVPVEVRARQIAPGPVPGEATRRALETRLRRFFHPLWGGFDGTGFPAGTWIEAEDIAVVLGAPPSRDPSRGPGAGGAPDVRPATGGDLAGLGDWDPRLWRFEVTVVGGDGGCPRLETGRPHLTVPVLERFVFAHE